MKALVVCGVLAFSFVALAGSESETAYQDIQKTFGFVPAFYKAVPESAIAGAWEEQKGVEMNPKSALPLRTKELIGLAVAAQIPCHYCAYFHTKAAKANGASDEQVKEAIAVAALERHWSTIVNGLQIDLPQFKQEVTKMFQYVAKHPPANAKAQPAPVTDAASAYQDMQQMFGMVPTFMKQLPPEAVVGAWREVKAFALSPTALDQKTKDLISLGVAAQQPCVYRTYFDTEAARADGATDAEIHEAIAMAAVTRHWSTVLNGSQIDEPAFRKEVDRIFKNAEKPNKTAQRAPNP